MRLNPLFLLVPTLMCGPAAGENLAYDDAAKKLMKDSASEPLDAEAAQAAEMQDSANKSVEKAKNLKESMDRPPPALPVAGTPDAGKTAKDKPPGNSKGAPPKPAEAAPAGTSGDAATKAKPPEPATRPPRKSGKPSARRKH